MPTATVTLQNGTVVTIEGTAEEIRQLLEFYGASGSDQASPPRPTPKGKRAKRRSPAKTTPPKTGGVDLSAIINLVKSSDEAENIEKNILDRASVVDRTLLPLYIVHEYLDNAYGLTSGDVAKVTTDLGIPIRTPNASVTLSKTAARYVVADRVRKRGIPVRYKLTRRGVQYMKSVVSGSSNEG